MKLGAVRLNAAASYLNFVVLAVVGTVVNPLLLGYLGVSTFGIWKACQRFLDFATVADGRATQALKWVIAHRSGDADLAAKRRNVGAAIVVWLLWLPILLLVLGIIVAALPFLIKALSPGEAGMVRWVGAALALNILFMGLVTIPDSVLVGTNQGYRSTFITTLILVLSNVAILLAARAHLPLYVLGLIIALSSALNGLITLQAVRRRVSWWGCARPSKDNVRVLAKFSGWVLLWSLITKSLLSAETILLSTLVGSVAVTNYVFTNYVVQFALSICLMTGSAFMPKLGSTLGRGEADNAKAIISQVRELILAVVVIVGASILLFNRAFVTLWAGSERYMGDHINGLMVCAFVQLALLRNDAQIQDVGLDVGRKVIIGLTSSVLSLILGAIFFFSSNSILGIYVGLILGRFVMSVAFPILVGKMVGKLRYSLRPYIVSVAILLASYFIGINLQLSSLLSLIVGALTGGAILSGAAYALILSPGARRKILNRSG